ncbi:InlB B-repeat-containing protein [Kineothrix sedimenti]|uniref:InlB B-repeat-containing protein n=1 Tax=Kineothrix sedimenti TaxID=3123317 RepID=A0ABZ3F1I2_9FIRM
MKRKKETGKLFAVGFMTAGLLLAGCGNAQTQETGNAAEEVKTEAAEESVAAEETTYKVTFYDSDGTTVLKETEVADGALAEEYSPEKEGYVFVDWFATPQMSHKFDFGQPVTEDVSAFAGFVSYKADEREFAIVGSGTSSALLESNWGTSITDVHKMTKEESDSENIYTITLDLNEGDEFQFAIDTQWHNQRGYGYLDTISLDGRDYFYNSGGLGETSTKRSNIKCAVTGNYTFTLTTYPAEDTYDTSASDYSEESKEGFNVNPYDKITWTYNGEGTSNAEDMQVNYYIKGAVVTGWEDVYSEETEFTQDGDIYTLSIDLTEGDEFMFTSMVTAGDVSTVGTEYIRFTNIASDDADSHSFVSEGGGANLIAGQDGTYTFTYDVSSKVLAVSCK